MTRRSRATVSALVPRFVVRDARPSDLGAVLRLSRVLDSMNLPIDRRDLAATIRCSSRSFAGRLKDPAKALYLFVAEDRRARRVIGTSLIIAKHGTPHAPHYYLEVLTDERYSRALKKMFRHTYLHLRHSMDGPTEVGGLVVEPKRRRQGERIGSQLSFVRFLYIALHRERFATEVIAEMKPPLTASGENRFWQCYGARVTGLGFREADRLSSEDKEFIPALFPDVPIYTCMLPLEVQEEIAKVGSETIGAVRLLERIGLRFLNQVDPFDAGPYYGAPLDQVIPVREMRRVRLLPEENPRSTAEQSEFLIGVERRGFLAFRARGRIVEDLLFVPPALLDAFRLEVGQKAAAVPFP